MPLHDWTDERGWDGLHILWQTALLDWVQPRLPEGYRAYLGAVPALTIDSPNGRPDLMVRNWHPKEPATDSAASPSGAIEPDSEAVAVFELDPQLALHIDLHGQLVAAIEIVSSRNKDRQAARERYTSRYFGYLRQKGPSALDRRAASSSGVFVRGRHRG